jgi:hypothetical protein
LKGEAGEQRLLKGPASMCHAIPSSFRLILISGNFIAGIILLYRCIAEGHAGACAALLPQCRRYVSSGFCIMVEKQSRERQFVWLSEKSC